MDEKNESTIPGGFIPPNCGSHVKHDFGSCGRNLEDLYREKISNSIKIGFESLSNSLVECALILSSEDYAKSLVEERKAKKEKEEAKKKEEEEKKKKTKEESEKFLNLYKEKLKIRIHSMNISDVEKDEIIQSFTGSEPLKANSSRSVKTSISDISPFVKKAFCDTIKEVKPEFGKMIIGDSMNFDPMMLSLIVPEGTLPPLTFMALNLNDSKMPSPDPFMFMMMYGADQSKILPYLMMKSNS